MLEKGFHSNIPIYRQNFTVERRYDAVQYCNIFQKLLPERKQNISEMLDPQKRARYGVPFVNISEKLTAF